MPVTAPYESSPLNNCRCQTITFRLHGQAFYPVPGVSYYAGRIAKGNIPPEADNMNRKQALLGTPGNTEAPRAAHLNELFESVFAVPTPFYLITGQIRPHDLKALRYCTKRISQYFQLEQQRASVRKAQLEHLFGIPPIVMIITESLNTHDISRLSLVSLGLCHLLLGQPLAWRNVVYERLRPDITKPITNRSSDTLARHPCIHDLRKRYKTLEEGQHEGFSGRREVINFLGPGSLYCLTRFLEKSGGIRMQMITRLDLDESHAGADILRGIVESGARLQLLSVRHCVNMGVWAVAVLLGLDVPEDDMGSIYLGEGIPPTKHRSQAYTEYNVSEDETLPTYKGPLMDKLEVLRVEQSSIPILG